MWRPPAAVGANAFIAGPRGGYLDGPQRARHCLSPGSASSSHSPARRSSPRILLISTKPPQPVDIATERRIESALRTLLADRTAFVIAHRLSTIRDADLIVVLEHGQVVEQGTHDELMARRGLYTSLYGDWAEVA